jgi:hypothetical protein
MKAHRGSRGIAPLILNLGTKWRWEVNFTPRPLYSQEGTPVLIEQETGWTPEPVWTVFGEKLLPLPEFEPRNVQPDVVYVLCILFIKWASLHKIKNEK